LKERTTIEHLAKKYELQPSQISLWKYQALSNFGNLFHAEASNDFYRTRKKNLNYFS
jgi:hypothetical protein